MKIALLGYGNMGKEVESTLNVAKKHQVVAISLKKQGEKINQEGISKADVVIDFSSPTIVLENIKTVAALHKNMVVGTTGWYAELSTVEKIVKESKIGLIYAQNFSVGANIFFQITAYAASLFSKFEGYDVYGLEIHHTGKKDSPSGTALKIAKEVMANFPSKKTLITGTSDRKINPDEFQFASVRGGRNPGFHEVVFDSIADSITLSHAAHNRRGFAEGAIVAAEYIRNKKGLFNFDALFKN